MGLCPLLVILGSPSERYWLDTQQLEYNRDIDKLYIILECVRKRDVCLSVCIYIYTLNIYIYTYMYTHIYIYVFPPRKKWEIQQQKHAFDQWTTHANSLFWWLSNILFKVNLALGRVWQMARPPADTICIHFFFWEGQLSKNMKHRINCKSVGKMNLVYLLQTLQWIYTNWHVPNDGSVG